MKRRAILIEAANLKGQDYLPGAEEDVKNYRRYLTSVEGGAWYSNEIIQLSKPNKQNLLDEIKRAEREASYLFLAFSGHGYMKRPQTQSSFIQQSDKQLTMLCINDVQEISIAEINPSIKNFIIADSCRGVEKVSKALSFVEALNAALRDSTENVARKLFDNAVFGAEAGQIVAYSCGINESAGEDPNRGGYFSAAMMDCGFDSTRLGTQRAITTDDIFKCAFTRVKNQAAQQNPQYSAGRRMRHFPFSVKI